MLRDELRDSKFQTFKNVKIETILKFDYVIAKSTLRMILLFFRSKNLKQFDRRRS